MILPDKVDCVCNERYLWPDCMRIIAISIVLLLHAAAPLLYQWNRIPEVWWHIGNIYDSATRMGVPLFLLLSGALLLKKKEGHLEFYRKRFMKIAGPFLFWITVFIVWRLFFHNENMNLKTIIAAVATGDVYFHLKFIYYLIGIYLCVPILRKFKFARFLVISCFFLASVTAIINKFGNISVPAPSPFGFFAYFGYFAVGGMLSNNNNINSKYIKHIMILLVSGFLITDIGTYVITKKTGIFDNFFYNYGALNVVIFSVPAFMLIRHFVAKGGIPTRFNKYITRASQAVFGVYFIHVIYLEMLQEGTLGFTISGMVRPPLVTIPVTAITAMLLSFTSIFLLMKVPVLGKIVT